MYTLDMSNPQIDKDSFLWSYLPEEIQGLVVDGEALFQHVSDQTVREKFSDFSFLVFPFAKAYEGFLKKLFLDIKLISTEDYYGDDIRIGRILSPNFMKEKGNIFKKMCNHSKTREDLAQMLWKTWKVGRNMVFHYFPHNFRKLDYQEAVDIVTRIIDAMENSVQGCQLGEYKKEKISKLT